ncbi:hypothetical protein PM082_002390 [Marasmius tenuissimus]|nr:hypothetical protein PM082_002390 [Marasmius tenuissimus]
MRRPDPNLRVLRVGRDQDLVDDTALVLLSGVETALLECVRVRWPNSSLSSGTGAVLLMLSSPRTPVPGATNPSSSSLSYVPCFIRSVFSRNDFSNSSSC